MTSETIEATVAEEVEEVLADESHQIQWATGAPKALITPIVERCIPLAAEFLNINRELAGSMTDDDLKKSQLVWAYDQSMTNPFAYQSGVEFGTNEAGQKTMQVLGAVTGRELPNQHGHNMMFVGPSFYTSDAADLVGPLVLELLKHENANRGRGELMARKANGRIQNVAAKHEALLQLYGFDAVFGGRNDKQIIAAIPPLIEPHEAEVARYNAYVFGLLCREALNIKSDFDLAIWLPADTPKKATQTTKRVWYWGGFESEGVKKVDTNRKDDSPCLVRFDIPFLPCDYLRNPIPVYDGDEPDCPEGALTTQLMQRYVTGDQAAITAVNAAIAAADEVAEVTAATRKAAKKALKAADSEKNAKFGAVLKEFGVDTVEELQELLGH